MRLSESCGGIGGLRKKKNRDTLSDGAEGRIRLRPQCRVTLSQQRPWQCSGQLLVLPSWVLGQLGASVEQGELHTCLTPYTKSMLDARQAEE